MVLSPSHLSFALLPTRQRDEARDFKELTPPQDLLGDKKSIIDSSYPVNQDRYQSIQR